MKKEGKILILGTHNCYTFDKLCKYFGYDRCIGYDLHNPTNHPNVVIKNCMKLDDDDKMDIEDDDMLIMDDKNFISDKKVKI